MKITESDAILLGLDRYDRVILKSLSSKKNTISELSLSTSIPRTSLYYMLPKLERRGFLVHHKIQKKVYWKTNTLGEIKDVYSRVFTENESENCKIITESISNKSMIALYKGNKNIVKILMDISNLSSQSRFYGIQPEQSIIEAVRKVPIKEILEFNKKVNGKKLIVEGIIHEKGTDSMVEDLGEDDKLKVLKSFANRSADTVKLPDDFLVNTKAEIYLYEDKVAIVNWFEEFAVVIKNKDAFELMKGMFDSTKYLLKKYDQNEKIARKLIDFENE